MAIEAPGKQEYVCRELSRSILLGRFNDTGRLPSDRRLAQEFKVSYMTVRRAVAVLLKEGLVVRRPRRGTFINRSSRPAGSRVKTLNVICMAEENAALSRFISDASDNAEKHGWRPVVVRVPEGSQTAAVEAILGPGASLVRMNEYFGWDAITRALNVAADRVAVVGSRLDDFGVLSIMGDDMAAMLMAVRYLRSKGHTRIGLAMHHPELRHARLRMATWRSALSDVCSEEELQRALIVVDIPPYSSHAQFAYERVRKHLASGARELTAMVCINDGIAMGAMAACRDAGVRIPEEMSFVSLSNTDIGRFAQVAMTCVEIDVQRETEWALNLLDRRLRSELPEWDSLRLVPPRLIERQSVAARSS